MEPADSRSLHLVFVLADGELPAALERVVERLQNGFSGAAELTGTYLVGAESEAPETPADAVVCLPEAGVDRLPDTLLRGVRRPDALVYLPAGAGRVPAGMLSAAAEATGRVVFARYQDAAELERRLEADLRAVLQDRLARGPATMATYAGTWTGGSPYRGLEPYDLEHAPIFFGRSREIEESVDRLREAAKAGKPVLLVEGVSGCGKTSLMQAGITPKLLRPGTVRDVGLWRRARLDTGAGDLVVALAEALCSPAALPELTLDGTTVGGVAEILHENPRAAGIVLRGALNLAASERKHKEGLDHLPVARLLLEVDAVERVFSVPKADREVFLTLLNTLARSGLVWLVLTGRDHRVAEHRTSSGWAELWEGAACYTLPPPNLQELGQIIRQPALAAGLDFEQDPTSGVRLDSLVRETIGRAPGALPLLSLYLERLFRAGARGGWITFAGYYEVGGFENVLGEHAENIFSALPQEAQEAFKAVFGRLVSVSLSEDERLLVRFGPLGDLTADAAGRELVEGLVEGRVLVAGLRPDGVAGVVLAHDGLLAQWARVKRLVEDDREFLLLRARLELDSRRWNRLGQKHDLLLRGGTELDEAESLLRTRAQDLTPEEAAYVRASADADSAQKRAQREEREAADLERTRTAAEEGRRRMIQRSVMAAVILLSLGLLGAGGWYAWERIGQSEFAADTARELQVRAEAAEVAARQARERTEAFAAEATTLALAAAADDAARLALAARVRAFYGPNATPAEPRDHLLLGLASLEEGREGSLATVERAAGWLEVAAAHDSTAYLGGLWLAEARWLLGQRAASERARAEAWAGALAAWDKVRERSPHAVDPRRAEAAEALVDLYLAQGRPRQAAEAGRIRLAAGLAMGEPTDDLAARATDLARKLLGTAEPASATWLLATWSTDAALALSEAGRAQAAFAERRALLARGEAAQALANAEAERDRTAESGSILANAAARVDEARAQLALGDAAAARAALDAATAALTRGRNQEPWQPAWAVWQARAGAVAALLEQPRSEARAAARAAEVASTWTTLEATGAQTPWDRDDLADLTMLEAQAALASRRWAQARERVEAALAAGYPVNLLASPTVDTLRRTAHAQALLTKAVGQLNEPAREAELLEREIAAWDALAKVAADAVDRRRLVEVLGLLAPSRSGAAAQRLHERRREDLETLVRENPGDAALRRDLDRALAQLASTGAGGTEANLALLRQRISLLERDAEANPSGDAARTLAGLLRDWETAADRLGRADEARQARQRQLDLAQAAAPGGALTPEIAELRLRAAEDLATVEPGPAQARLAALTGDLEQRIQQLNEARENPDRLRLVLVRVLARRAALSDAAGDSAGAAAADDAALPVAELLANRDPGNDDAQLVFAELLVRVGSRLIARQELEAASQAFRRARDLLAPIFEMRPNDTRVLEPLATATEGAGDLALETRRPDDARVLFQELLAIRSTLARTTPGDRTAIRHLATARLRLGEALLQLQRITEAEPLLRESRRALEQLGGEAVRGELALVIGHMADVATRQGRTSEALEAYRQAETLGQALRRATPDDPRWGLYLLGVHQAVAQLQVSQRDRGAAIVAYEKALAVLRDLRAREGASLAGLRGDEVQILRRLATQYQERNEPEQARRVLEDLVRLGQEELNADPNNTRVIDDLHQVHVRLGSLHASMSRPADALRAFRQGLEMLQILAARAPDNMDRQWALAGLNNQIAIAHIDLREPSRAREHLLPAMAQLERVARSRPADPRVRLDLIGTYLNWLGTYGDRLADNRDEVTRVFNLAANLLEALQNDEGLSSEQQALVRRMVTTHQAFLDRLNAPRVDS